MGSTTHSLEVNAPVGAVYDQWTQFEEFPRFMEGVVEIQRHDAKRLLWKVNIGGKDKEWEAEILEQVPDTRIVWESVDGTQNRGVIAFESLELDRTLITLTMEYEPEGFLEMAGDALGIPSGQVEGNLKRFRDFIERREMENGSLDVQSNQGVVNGERTGVIKSRPLYSTSTQTAEIVSPKDEEEEIEKPRPVEHSSLLSAEPATEFLPEEEASLTPLTKAEEGDLESSRDHRKIGLLSEEIERAQPVEDPSLLSADPGMEPFAEEAPLPPAAKPGEGHSEFYRDAEVLSPTHGQIAERAFELFLARGGVHGYEREDWLEAEKQLREHPVKTETPGK
jgi:uncharacterized protein YndB with AHSA1/START domain